MLLETRDLTAFYGDFQALFGVNIALNEGETIAIIGANGAGKTTLLRSISGVLNNAAGMVQFEGSPVGDVPADTLVARGIAMVPEGRKLFPSLSVEENLMIGGYCGRTGVNWNLEAVYELFPILREKRKNPSTALSGGQQQMVAIGRALMSNPRVLLCDEISLGLAPVVIKDIYANIPKIKAAGASIVIIEQDVGQALKVADRIYCMMEGRISLTGKPSEITREQVHAAYFGVAA
jgi:branched-chain amino acid transport system ATP-binding protein